MANILKNPEVNLALTLSRASNDAVGPFHPHHYFPSVSRLYSPASSYIAGTRSLSAALDFSLFYPETLVEKKMFLLWISLQKFQTEFNFSGLSLP